MTTSTTITTRQTQYIYRQHDVSLILHYAPCVFQIMLNSLFELIWSTMAVGLALFVCVFFYMNGSIPQRRMYSFITMSESASSEKQVKPTKKGRISKPRAVARPYKKLTRDVLDTRVTTMQKQMSIFSSKMTLLGARLANYEKECQMRDAEPST